MSQANMSKETPKTSDTKRFVETSLDAFDFGDNEEVQDTKLGTPGAEDSKWEERLKSMDQRKEPESS